MNNIQQCKIQLKGKVIDNNNIFICLGSVIDNDSIFICLCSVVTYTGGTNEDVKCRVGKTSHTFTTLTQFGLQIPSQQEIQFEFSIGML